MNYATISVEWHTPQIAILTLNRKDKRNALNIQLLQELCDCLLHLEKETLLRALIFNGAGAVFCAGLDLKEATQKDVRERSLVLLASLFKAIDALPFLTIAAVHGAAIAGGCGLMCACDFVLAAEGTEFAFPEVKRGLLPALVAVLLQRKLSTSAVRELLLFGEPIDAKRALEIGLINRIVPPAALLTEVVHIAEKACSGFPEAVAGTKKLLRELGGGSLAADFDLALAAHRKARSSSAAEQGIAAFLESRPHLDCGPDRPRNLH